MLRSVTQMEYVQLRRDKCKREESIDLVVVGVLRSVVYEHMPTLSGSEICVLFYLLGATVMRSQSAREISVQEFSKGLRDIDGSRLDGGTGLSKPTILTALRSLCDGDFINMYRLEEQNGWEVSPRIYEINFKLLGARGVKNFNGGSKNFTPLHTSNVVTTCSVNRDTSISFLRGSSLAPENKVGAVDSMAFVGKRKVVKPRPQLGYGSAEEAVSAITARYRNKSEARVVASTGKAAASIDKEEMQALFDKHGKAVGLSYRVMVTQREFGFLRKRLAVNPPADFSDFVRWCLTYWGTIARQNHGAVRKDSTRTGKKMPESPHFNTFTYWYPYLFRAYQNYQAGSDWKPDSALPDTEAQVRIKALERRVAVAEQGADLLRRKVEATATTAGPLRVLRRKVEPAKVSDDDLHSPISFKDWDSVSRK